MQITHWIYDFFTAMHFFMDFFLFEQWFFLPIRISQTKDELFYDSYLVGVIQKSREQFFPHSWLPTHP